MESQTYLYNMNRKWKKLDEHGNENINGIYGIFQDCNYP